MALPPVLEISALSGVDGFVINDVTDFSGSGWSGQFCRRRHRRPRHCYIAFGGGKAPPPAFPPGTSPANRAPAAGDDAHVVERSQLLVVAGPAVPGNSIAIAGLADILTRMGDGPDGVSIELGGGQGIVLAGILKNQLSTDDFAIV